MRAVFLMENSESPEFALKYRTSKAGPPVLFVPEGPPHGVYLNLVEGRLWVPDVVGSNPITPTAAT